MPHPHISGCTENLRRLGLALPPGTENLDDADEFTRRLHVASHALARAGGAEDADDSDPVDPFTGRRPDGTLHPDVRPVMMSTLSEEEAWIEARAAKVSAEIAGTRQAHADTEEDEISRRAAKVSTPRS